jgi:hypothetical protein
VGYFSIVKAQVIRRGIVGVKHSQVLRFEMLIACLSWLDGKQKRHVRLVGIEQEELAKIVSIVVRDDGEARI